MGFYNLIGDSSSATQESAPGANSIVSEAYVSSSSWSTSITFSTGTYAIYVSNLSSPAISFSLTHPTKSLYSKSLQVAANKSILQYIDGDSQNIIISLTSVDQSYIQISKIEEA
jgi:hypothetical protein